MPDAYDRITLLCRLKAAQTRNKELESGERYVRLKELHQKECRGYGSRILELQKEAADAHKETIRVRNYWFQVLEDMLLDFENSAIFVNRAMCYVQGENGYYFEVHSPKTICGKRLIPMTNKCAEALMRQKLVQLSEMLHENAKFANLVFPTMRNRPLQEMSIITSINIIPFKILGKSLQLLKSLKTFRREYTSLLFYAKMSLR